MEGTFSVLLVLQMMKKKQAKEREGTLRTIGGRRRRRGVEKKKEKILNSIAARWLGGGGDGARVVDDALLLRPVRRRFLRQRRHLGRTGFCPGRGLLAHQRLDNAAVRQRATSCRRRVRQHHSLVLLLLLQVLVLDPRLRRRRPQHGLVRLALEEGGEGTVDVVPDAAPARVGTLRRREKTKADVLVQGQRHGMRVRQRRPVLERCVDGAAAQPGGLLPPLYHRLARVEPRLLEVPRLDVVVLLRRREQLRGGDVLLHAPDRVPPPRGLAVGASQPRVVVQVRLDEVDGLVVRVARLRHAVDHAQLQPLVRRHRLPGRRQQEGRPRGGQPRKPLRAAPAWRDAVVRVRKLEDRVLGRDAEVTREGDLGGAAGGDALDRGDGDDGQVLQLQQDAAHVA
eukprot:Rhum_TRINITY_DN14646_c3_g1::Rhum_TRINITY_DN14646_c3_g1_i1::g.102892::m.102892